jgi:hypothetical protein
MFCLEKFGSYIFVNRIVFREFQGHIQPENDQYKDIHSCETSHMFRQ